MEKAKSRLWLLGSEQDGHIASSIYRVSSTSQPGVGRPSDGQKGRGAGKKGRQWARPESHQGRPQAMTHRALHPQGLSRNADHAEVPCFRGGTTEAKQGAAGQGPLGLLGHPLPAGGCPWGQLTQQLCPQVGFKKPLLRLQKSSDEKSSIT